jgi:hypothetical protein
MPVRCYPRKWMWVERAGEFEQNLQSVEGFALAEVAE